MWKCPKCGEEIEDRFDKCWKCANNGVDISPEVEITPDGEQTPADISDMILVTIPSVPGHEITRTFGVVCGETIMGTSLLADLCATAADWVGVRSLGYEVRLAEARELALSEMAVSAKEKGANAVVGVKLDYETVRHSMLMVTACGTAVLAEPETT